jgi:hypothetical protein
MHNLRKSANSEETYSPWPVRLRYRARKAEQIEALGILKINTFALHLQSHFMKPNIFLVLFCLLAGTVCVSAQHFGEKFGEKNVITMKELEAQMKNKTELKATVTGKVVAVCQEMGCWIKIQKTDGSLMMVKMKDHAFFLPKNISGKTVIFTGVASIVSTSVEDLKHYAADEGKSEAYIQSISKPTTELEFEAAGVIVK